ncbi:MAG TPA: hydrolase [Flavobacteriales bacterium]|nr:hydrolase [Flavobacteriales bacterium]
MKIIDLTHPVSQKMPVYPGTEPPIFEVGCSIEEDGFLEKKITFYSHTGTHIDAPAHLINTAKTLDLFPAQHFFGKAFQVNLSKKKIESIGISELKPHKEAIQQVDFLLIHTGWSQYWGEERYFRNFPVLSLEAANWLCMFNLKGVGIDTISADSEDSKEFPIHKVFLQRDIIIIENIANLTELPTDEFTFSCFPLKLQDADGSPVRAIAYL